MGRGGGLVYGPELGSGRGWDKVPGRPPPGSPADGRNLKSERAV